MSERTIARTPDTRLAGWLYAMPCFGVAVEFGSGVGTYTDMLPALEKHGIESFEPYYQEACSSHTAVFHHGDMRQFEHTAPQDFDLAVFIDSLEHITHADGADLIRRLQARCQRIIVFCPRGWHENPPCDGNELNEHVSAWTEDELAALGFVVAIAINYHCDDPLSPSDALFATWSRGHQE
jgi:hypothetical protein